MTFGGLPILALFGSGTMSDLSLVCEQERTLSPRFNSRSRDAGRDEIISCLSWDCLVRLAPPTLPAAARSAVGSRVIAGAKIVASDVVHARAPQAAG